MTKKVGELSSWRHFPLHDKSSMKFTYFFLQIRGRTLFAQYSTHRELKFDKNKAVSDTEVSFFSYLFEYEKTYETPIVLGRNCNIQERKT